ncbi:hypothetical protein SAMN04487760_10562 [Lachnospiraceae bacterium G41]|nr:hypothetical protein SAMN04487760_10562 [Lachnospiraceae bacterium G41]
MVKQRPWDKYEAAILLDAYLRVRDGELNRKEAISLVSDKLRRRAIILGFDIDETYRNEAGILFQMHSMESAYMGYTVLKPASKLFLDVVEIWKNDKAEFMSILQFAMNKSDNKSVEGEFLSWLARRVNDKQLSELYIMFTQIDDFCLEQDILYDHLFRTTDLKKLLDVEKAIKENEVFLKKYKRQINKMLSAINFYLLYVKEEIIEKANSIGLEDKNQGKENKKKISSVSSRITENKSSQFVDIKKRQKEFTDWMIQNKTNSFTSKTYLSSLSLAGEIASAKGIINGNIYEIHDEELLRESLEELLTIPEFLKKNEERFNQLVTSWKKYIDFTGCVNSYQECEDIDLYSTRSISQNDKNTIYMRLKSMVNVYGVLENVSLDWIKTNIRVIVEKEELREILNELSWVKRVDEDKYTIMLDDGKKRAGDEEQEPDHIEVKVNKDIDLGFNKNSFVKVLMMRYQNGMKFDSIDIENYKETYLDIIGEEINLSDEKLEKCLHKCGIMYQGRLFPAEGIINNSVREKLMDYIYSNFSNGKNVLYYKSILSDLSDAFAYCYNLTDYKMLKAYLEYTCEQDEFYFSDEYLSKEKNVSIDHESEIEDFMLMNRRPLSYDEIYSGLSHISKDIIFNEIRSNPKYLLNEKEHYYHFDIFELSSEEADLITDYINEEIYDEGYCIWSRIYKKIQNNLPIFIENNACLSSLGIRNGLSKKLKGRFHFDGEVISSCKEALNMSAVFRLFGEHHAPFTDEDLYNFSKEVNSGGPYFESLSETTIRVSKELFVSRKDITFDVQSVDEAISTYFSGEYVLIKDFDSFLMFPTVNYEWNIFMLESYLIYFSKKYTLLNNGRSLGNVAGAVIKKGGIYKDFEDLCADVIANSACALTKDKALDLLAEKNLLTRKSYSKIENAISKAKQIRNRRG